MAHLSVIAACVLANPAPVLLVDACAILDIIRAPLPARKLALHLPYVSKVLTAQHQPDCLLAD